MKLLPEKSSEGVLIHRPSIRNKADKRSFKNSEYNKEQNANSKAACQAMTEDIGHFLLVAAPVRSYYQCAASDTYEVGNEVYDRNIRFDNVYGTEDRVIKELSGHGFIKKNPHAFQ